jgi:hypothetical protein
MPDLCVVVMVASDPRAAARSEDQRPMPPAPLAIRIARSLLDAPAGGVRVRLAIIRAIRPLLDCSSAPLLLGNPRPGAPAIRLSLR